MRAGVCVSVYVCVCVCVCVGILTKYVGEISWPDVLVNLEYFIIKNEMQNSINIQSPRNQTFTGDDGF